MNIVMYAHGGSGNHGCEAIVRSTHILLSNVADNSLLLSYEPNEDIQYGLDKIVNIKKELSDINKLSIDFLGAYLKQKINHDYHKMDSLMHKKSIDSMDNCDAALFVGGDNYCYSDVKNYKLINDYIQKKANKLILWGTSVSPELLKDKYIASDIGRFHKVFARESLSYEALKNVNKNTVLLPDPAFYLPAEETELPIFFENKKMIGINISPMVISHEKNKGQIIRGYENLIEYIIKNTDYNIALIPHVVWASNDDRIPLKYLYDKYKETNRVVFVKDHNCMQQKYIISKCQFFIGSRTHSTIAAYSSCVPTLVVGYSVKANGIAKDLFGTSENYVLSAREMTDINELTEKFIWLVDNSKSIENRLSERRIEYTELKSEYEKEFVI